MKTIISLLSISLLLICSFSSSQAQLIADVDAIQSAPLHAGVSRTYKHDFKSVIKAARETIVESGLVLESASKVDDDTYMLVSKAKTSAFSWGELVRVVVEKEGANESTIRVYSKRRVKVNLTAKADYSNTIISNMDLKLDL